MISDVSGVRRPRSARLIQPMPAARPDRTGRAHPDPGEDELVLAA